MPIDFASPSWLVAGAIACAVLGLLVWRGERRRRAAIRVLAGSTPVTSLATGRRWLRHGLALIGVACAFVALARPRAGYRWEKTPRQGLDLVLAIDTSRSMRAADLRPDRLTRAKLATQDLLQRFDGDRVGLVAFAGSAFVQAPMTIDHATLREALAALDTDVIPRGGSDLAAAIRTAREAMSSEPDHRKLLVLLSDGEDLAGGALAAARDAATAGVTIHTIGVGSQRGELIQVPGPDGTPTLVRDEHGEPVRSRLDEQTLRSIAQVTGGTYHPLGADGRGLDALYETELAKLPRSVVVDARKVYAERFQIPLALALGCLLLELVIGDRRRRSKTAVAAVRAEPSRARSVALATLFAIVGLPQIAGAETVDATGSYNDGTAAYRKGEFAVAEQDFQRALRTGDVGLQSNAYYNLGNARYREGQQTLAQDRAKTITAWKQALDAYDTALGLDRDDADARFNRDLVARKLAALEEKDKDKDKEKKDNEKPANDQNQKQQPQNGQGQPDQKQQGPGQDKQDQKPQPQNGQGQPDQKQQGPGQQDPKQQGQQPQSSGPPDRQQGPSKQSPQRDAGGEQPADPRDGQGASAADDREAEQARADSARRAAGQLTHGEAMQLLDSVQGELRPMPSDPVHPTPETPIRDW